MDFRVSVKIGIIFYIYAQIYLANDLNKNTSDAHASLRFSPPDITLIMLFAQFERPNLVF